LLSFVYQFLFCSGCFSTTTSSRHQVRRDADAIRKRALSAGYQFTDLCVFNIQAETTGFKFISQEILENDELDMKLEYAICENFICVADRGEI
jgi:hypothetical protein